MVFVTLNQKAPILHLDIQLVRSLKTVEASYPTFTARFEFLLLVVIGSGRGSLLSERESLRANDRYGVLLLIPKSMTFERKFWS